MIPCIPSDVFLRVVGNYGKRTKWKSSCFIHSFFIITWSCISLNPPHLFSAALIMDAARKCLLKPFCQKITKDHISLAHSMTAGLAVSKKPLGLHCPSTKMLFSTWSGLWSGCWGFLPSPPRRRMEDGTGKPCKSPDTDQGSLGRMRNGL